MLNDFTACPMNNPIRNYSDQQLFKRDFFTKGKNFSIECIPLFLLYQTRIIFLETILIKVQLFSHVKYKVLEYLKKKFYHLFQVRMVLKIVTQKITIKNSMLIVPFET